MSSGPSRTPASKEFLDLPVEIQRRIIEVTLEIERKAFRPSLARDLLDNTSVPKIYDFNINAYGIRSHTLPPFGLLFVNKHVSGEALAVVYQNSSFIIHAEIARDGLRDEAFGCIPKVVERISPMILENAREVTYRISTIHEGPKARSTHSRTLNRALDDLKLLGETAVFPHVKTLNLILVTEGLVQKHLNLIFKLFVVTGCFVTLEEACNGGFGVGGSQEDRTEFAKMINIAAGERGQGWVVTGKKIADVTSTSGYWRGMKVLWARRRAWDRRFTPTGDYSDVFQKLRSSLHAQ